MRQGLGGETGGGSSETALGADACRLQLDEGENRRSSPGRRNRGSRSTSPAGSTGESPGRQWDRHGAVGEPNPPTIFFFRHDLFVARARPRSDSDGGSRTGGGKKTGS